MDADAGLRPQTPAAMNRPITETKTNSRHITSTFLSSKFCSATTCEIASKNDPVWKTCESASNFDPA